MKTIRHFLKKGQNLVSGSWVKVLVVALAFAAPVVPAPVPVLGPTVAEATSSKAQFKGATSSQEAVDQFETLFRTFQVFAGVLLLIGCVIAGIMFMTGKTSMAIMVFGGAVVIFGGSFLVGLVRDALTTE